MADAIVVLNAGSSSIKFSVFRIDAESPALMLRGQIEGLYTPPASSPRMRPGRHRHPRTGTAKGRSGTTARSASCSTTCTANSRGYRVRAFGHRVVHGGTDYDRPVRLDSTRGRSTSSNFIPLAPLHQPHNLAAIRALLGARAATAAGRLLRHLVPSPAADGRAGLRAAAGDHRPRRASLRLPRAVVRIHRRDAAAARRRGGAGPRRRRAPGQRRQHVRDRRRPQRDLDDGLHRRRGSADGHPLRLARSRRACST